MRTSNLRAREDFDAILASTLSDHWTRTTGETVEARPDDGGDGQLWQDHSLLTGVFCADASPAVIRYMRDELRYTPVVHRAPAQWILGSLVASRPALKTLTRPILRVSPSVKGGEHVLILTGHRRLRLLDFAGGHSLTLVKSGYDRRCITREIAIRNGAGPFVAIETSDPEGRWLREPLIQGRSLPRIPGAARRNRVLTDTIARLDQWQREMERRVSSAAHLSSLTEKIREHLVTLEDKHGADSITGVTSWLEPLEQRVLARDALPVATTHGDLQAGNILVDPQKDLGFVVDLEYARPRFRLYDLLCWGLQARPAIDGLDHRLARFVRRGDLRDVTDLIPETQDPAWRQWASALFVLEELERLGEEATSGPCHDPGPPWRHFVETLKSLRAHEPTLFEGP
ncbi:MAG: phosphotransferase [Myxococcota bacterium]|nr:phosphotransferase [Myxococcota bacterium]